MVMISSRRSNSGCTASLCAGERIEAAPLPVSARKEEKKVLISL
jgi:hypothetical protein